MGPGREVNLQWLGKGFLLPMLLSPLLAVVLPAALYLLPAFPSQRAMDAAHFLSAGAVSFARGLNDTPKIAAMLLAVPALDMRRGSIAVAAAMAVGGLLNARRVAETMSLKITSLDHRQGFAADL